MFTCVRASLSELEFDYMHHCVRAANEGFRPLTFTRFVGIVLAMTNDGEVLV